MSPTTRSLYRGISTHNAQNIDVSLAHGTITVLSGPSGSGKSSVAIDTIYGISRDELGQLMNLEEVIAAYSIKSYQNILPAICLSQENYNQNPRSTIATYFNVDLYFRELFSLASKRPPRFFGFNLSETMCRACGGLGSRLQPEPLNFVDYSAKIRDIPFKSWRRSNVDLYRQLLELFCHDAGINVSARLKDLSTTTQDLLIWGRSETRYKIKFVSNGRRHSKTTQYVGPATQLAQELTRARPTLQSRQFLSERPCSACGGSRFSEEVLAYSVSGKTIGDVYGLPVASLSTWVSQCQQKAKSANERSLWARIGEFLASMSLLRLDYLALGRSIPSLSGGELQRLRLAKARNSQFTNFLYVLDEPTAGLHPSELERIGAIVVELKRRANTVLVVEHGRRLAAIADQVVLLGPGGGSAGGRIVSASAGDGVPEVGLSYAFYKCADRVRVEGASFNNVRELCVDLPTSTLVGVCGVSGSGKTSFMRGILPRYLDETAYLRQAPIRGNAYSIVATYLGIYPVVQSMFARHCKEPALSFSFLTKGPGQCALCRGKGVLVDDFATPLKCPDCQGMRFGPRSLKHRYGEFNIFEFLSLDIDRLVEIVPPREKALSDALALASSMGLGYLSLFQDTATLSGGEAQRVKLAQTILRAKAKRTLLLDEPFRGVDEGNVKKIVALLYSLVEGGYTVYIAEHDLVALRYCSYIIEFGPGAGDAGGKLLFSGELSDVGKCQASVIGRYLVGTS